jgi:hypothetical protein
MEIVVIITGGNISGEHNQLIKKMVAKKEESLKKSEILTGDNPIKEYLKHKADLKENPVLNPECATIAKGIKAIIDEHRMAEEYPSSLKNLSEIAILCQLDQEITFAETAITIETALINYDDTTIYRLDNEFTLLEGYNPKMDEKWSPYKNIKDIAVNQYKGLCLILVGHGTINGETSFANDKIQNPRDIKDILLIPDDQKVLFIPLQCFPKKAQGLAKNIGWYSACELNSEEEDRTTSSSGTDQWIKNQLLDVINACFGTKIKEQEMPDYVYHEENEMDEYNPNDYDPNYYENEEENDDENEPYNEEDNNADEKENADKKEKKEPYNEAANSVEQ